MTLAPLRFEPIFKTMLWGGSRLRPMLGRPASDEPTGEAWLLSDVDGSESRVAGGDHDGKTLRDLISKYPHDLLGNVQPINGRFPLLIKLIDAKHELSVQVHPNDEQARAKDPKAAGKTEAWVILESHPERSRVYSGFQPGMTAERFQQALSNGTAANTLHQFNPNRGDCLFLRAGTVHAIGAELLVFEVQQTSDITYRLFDWNRVDAKTGQPRQLHVTDGLACSHFAGGPCPPVVPKKDGERESLVDCEYFHLDRFTLNRPAEIRGGRCRIITCIEGRGALNGLPMAVGDTFLLPASLENASIVPTHSITLLVSAPGAGS